MSLDKHRVDGLPKILDRTMVTSRFEQLLIDADYGKVGTSPAKGDRVKAWWIHPPVASSHCVLRKLAHNPTNC
jgi:hypothetical protein